MTKSLEPSVRRKFFKINLFFLNGFSAPKLLPVIKTEGFKPLKSSKLKTKHKCKFISFISGPPRHRCQLQSHEHHEFLRQRLVRAYRCRGFQIGPLQQEVHHHLPGDPNRRQVRFCLFRLNFVKLSKNRVQMF